jgi:adenosylcobyric acid synthase
MNPILIKPTAEKKAQIVVLGKPIGNMDALEYHRYKNKLWPVVKKSLQALMAKYEIVVIEGAGSPAEINLKEGDLVNLKVAREFSPPVILVGDIEKGGVFAWLAGTMELLEKEEKEKVKGFIINKFRGEKKLLKSALDFLEKKYGKKVFGVIPYFEEIKIFEEDSLGLEKEKSSLEKKKLNINVLRLPRISNFTDFQPLEEEPDVQLKYISLNEKFNQPDLVIIPGTKNTIGDFLALVKSGKEKEIKRLAQEGVLILGICGGYQMLGEKISDPGGVEGRKKEIRGLGLLPLVTSFKVKKTLTQIKAKEISSGLEVEAYEIHQGKSKTLEKNFEPFFEIIRRQGRKTSQKEGMKKGNIWGTYLHGIFEEAKFRQNFLNYLRKRKGLPAETPKKKIFHPQREYSKLAELVRKHLDLKAIYQILR